MSVDVAAIMSAAEARAEELSERAEAVLRSIPLSNVPALPDDVPLVQLEEIELPELPAAPSITAPVIPSLAPLGPAPTVQSIVASFPSAPTTQLRAAPAVNEPVRPAEIERFSKAVPTINLPPAPSRPESRTFDIPSINSISMPARPDRAVHAFSGARPEGLGSAPTLDGKLESSYRSASPLMTDSIQAKVDAWLNSIDPTFTARRNSMEEKIAAYLRGGTALNPVVENAIYERSKSKVDAETRRMQAEAMKSAARRGFTLPNGAVMSAMLQARQAGADNNSKASVDIAIMQAEMEQKNLQFAMSLSSDLHKTVMGASLTYHQNLISINGQAIQYAVEFLNAVIKVYDLEVRAFTAKLEGYKADANVFETLVRASLAEIEIYKAEIEGLKAGVQVDEAKVRACQAQIDAHKAAVEVYSLNVKAMVELANLEKVKLDVFQAEVQSYGMRTQAYAAEWQAYAAAWNGEDSKVRAFLAEAQAKTAEADVFRAQVSGESARIAALSESNRAELALHESRVRAFGAQAQANASIVSSQLGVQEALLRGYQIESQAIITAAGAAAEKYKAEGSIAIAHAGMVSTRDIESAKMFNSAMETQAKVAIAVGNSYAGLASAALGGINALAVGEQS